MNILLPKYIPRWKTKVTPMSEHLGGVAVSFPDPPSMLQEGSLKTRLGGVVTLGTQNKIKRVMREFLSS